MSSDIIDIRFDAQDQRKEIMGRQNAAQLYLAQDGEHRLQQLVSRLTSGQDGRNVKFTVNESFALELYRYKQLTNLDFGDDIDPEFVLDLKGASFLGSVPFYDTLKLDATYLNPSIKFRIERAVPPIRTVCIHMADDQMRLYREHRSVSV